MKKATLLIILLFVSGFALSVSGQKGKPKPSPTPTPSPTPAPSPTPGLNVKFRFLSCGEEYRGVIYDAGCENNVNQDIAGNWYVNNSEGVSAIISGASGDLIVGLDGSQRSLVLDFNDLLYDGDPTASFLNDSATQTVKPRFNFLRAYTAKQLCDGTPATTLYCEYTQGRLNMGSWYAEGTATSGPSAVSYKLIWNRDPPNDPDRPGNYPCHTAWVKIRYVKAVTGGAPEHFIITTVPRASNEMSSADPGITCAAGEILGGLETVMKRSTTAAGQFHMPFTAVAEILP